MSISNVSPLAPIKRFLSVLSWVGFPLRLDKKQEQETTFIWSRWDSLKFVLLTLTLVPYFLNNIIMLQSFDHFRAFSTFFTRLGFSLFDILAIMMVLCICLMNNFVGFCKIVRRRKEFTALFRSFERVCRGMDDQKNIAEASTRSIRSSMKMVCLIFVLTLVSGLGQGWVVYIVYKSMIGDDLSVSAWISILSAPMVNGIGMCGGAVSGVEAMLVYFPAFTAELLKCYVQGGIFAEGMRGGSRKLKLIKTTDKTELYGTIDKRLFVSRRYSQMLSDITNNEDENSAPHNIKSIDSDKSQERSDHFEIGFEICDLVVQMNSLFATLYVGQFLVCVVLCTMTMYTTATIFFTNAGLMSVVNSVTNAIYSLVFVIKMVGCSHYGQVLDNACIQARRDLDSFICSQLDDLSKKEQYRGRMLMSRMREVTPLQPWAFFPVNHANLVAAGSVVLTYLFILVQFKDNDVMESNRSCECNGTA